MDRNKNVHLVLSFALAAVALASSPATTIAAKYTAHTFVEVLPYPDRDPFALAAPPIDKDLQYQFRRSMAALMVTLPNLEDLLHRDKIKHSQWYKRRGEDVAVAVKDLQKSFSVVPREKGNCLEVSMTCSDARDAALIVNEMIMLFIDSRQELARARIIDKLRAVSEHSDRINQDLRAADKALDEVRRAWGFSDLEEHTYPHPVTARLIRLEAAKDDLALEIKGLEAAIEILQKSRSSSSTQQNELTILRAKFTEIHKLCDEAKAKQRDLDQARTAYKVRAAIRDERLRRLEEIKTVEQKLKLLLEDPDISRLRIVAPAPRPLFADPPRAGA